MIRLSIVVFAALSSNDLFAQPQFQSASKSEVNEILADFVENRERFKVFGCNGIVVCDEMDLNDDLSAQTVEFCIFEDSQKKLLRYDWRKSIVANPDKVVGWLSVFQRKGVRKAVIDRKEQSDSFSKHMISAFWQPKEPWAWPMLDLESLGQNLEDPLLWARIFRDDKLLTVQDNGTVIRAEWDVGPEARVQVYFDNRVGNMPVYCRYIVPIDKNESFSKKSRLLMNETETKWAKHLEGWVPVKIKNYRENLDRQNKVRSIESWQFTIDWNTSLVKEGTVDESIFEIGKLRAREANSTFSKGTSPTLH